MNRPEPSKSKSLAGPRSPSRLGPRDRRPAELSADISGRTHRAATLVANLPDGRQLSWLELGNPTGPAAFVFHGTPGSRLQLSFNDRAIGAAGVRFIAPDRPGYGHSTYQPGRRLTDWPSDVRVLADHLQIERFSVIGISGGGPHAAACARLLGDRVDALGIVSGVGPISEINSEGGAGRVADVISNLARRSHYWIVPPLALTSAMARLWPEAALRISSRQMPAVDLAVLARPEVTAAFVEERRCSSSTRAFAFAQDIALFVQDWGFRLEDIKVPAQIWHGTHDHNVPFAHGQYLAERIRGSTLHRCEGEGHLLAVDRTTEILRSVCAF